MGFSVTSSRKMESLNFLFGDRLNNADLLQQISLLAWLKGGEQGKKVLEFVTGLRVGTEIYNRLTGEQQLDEYRKECILGITQYIKAHPRASEKELKAEVMKHIELFAARVAAL